MSIHEKGDYLKYDGDFKPHGIVQLLEKVQNNKERLRVKHIKDGSEFICDYEDVNLIYTEENHLLKAGFKKVKVNDKNYYENGSMTVSIVNIRYPEPIRFGNGIFEGFKSHLVVNDNKLQEVEMSSYSKDNKFDQLKFYDEFPSCTSLSNLFKEIKKHDILIDEGDVATI